ncbi:RNA-processing protein [Archaeoglobales archaeon]|nr:MAG: RNA-processing protein [Archaeoglobales archaeon]
MCSNYKTWFGKIENGEVKVSNDFLKSFKDAWNELNVLPLPFSVAEIGKEVFGSEEEYYKVLRRVAIQIAEEKVNFEIRREDRYAVMLVKALDELINTMNLLEEKCDNIEEIKESDITAELRDKIRELKELRLKIEKEIEEVLTKIAPNLCEVLNPIVAARLLEKVGGLERLAYLPASKIQIIGAEKSLYKAFSRMRKGKKAKTPKHGVIFQHPFIKTLPKSKRGKMARFMSAKIAIAARIDFFKGELNEEVAESVRKRYEELRR